MMRMAISERFATSNFLEGRISAEVAGAFTGMEEPRFVGERSLSR
jgi:hypothetical protein